MLILLLAVPSAVSTLLEERETLFEEALMVARAASTLDEELDRFKLDV